MDSSPFSSQKSLYAPVGIDADGCAVETPDPGFLSAHSSSVKNAFPARSAGRSIGVVVVFVHAPCRSGWPQGV